MTTLEQADIERFEKAVLAAYYQTASSTDPTTAVMGAGNMGVFSLVVINPSDSPFARWALEQQIAVLTADGEVAFPYGGGHRRALVLAQCLLRAPGVTGTTIGEVCDGPPPAHGDRLEELRRRYDLPATLLTNSPLPDQLCL